MTFDDGGSRRTVEHLDQMTVSQWREGDRDPFAFEPPPGLRQVKRTASDELRALIAALREVQSDTTPTAAHHQ